MQIFNEKSQTCVLYFNYKLVFIEDSTALKWWFILGKKHKTIISFEEIKGTK